MFFNRHPHGWRQWALFPLIVVFPFLTASQLSPRLPLPGGQRPALQTFPTFTPPGRNSFFTVPEHTELSQSILYHGLGQSIENAKRADIIFLGNSRMSLGLREEFIVPRAKEAGLRVFSLGMGHSEGLVFLLDLMRKHDLRPAVVVVSGGPEFYQAGPSRVAQQAMKMSAWEARKQWFEEALTWEFRTRLHRLLPKVDVRNQRLHSGWIIYRSSVTGWWQPVASPPRLKAATLAEDQHEDWSDLLPLARELHAELQRRETLLVLTTVPGSETQLSHLDYLSRKLGVPRFIPDTTDLSLADNSHLTRESAQRVSNAFWDAFIKEPSVRRALKLDAH